MSVATAPEASRLLPRDVLRVGSIGLRTRKLRAALSALGIAIGIAALVAVLGISQSSQASLLAQIDSLGTNLLSVQPGQSFSSDTVTLPPESVPRIAHTPTVGQTAAVYTVMNTTVRRTQYVDPANTGGIAVEAADRTLPATLGGEMAAGRFLDRASARYPTVVLGYVAAQRLGLDSVSGHVQVYLGGHLFTVIGILRSLTLAPDVDRAALIGLPIAEALFGTQLNPSAIYLRPATAAVNSIYDRVPSIADPEHPEEVQVSRPSDALAARAAAKSAFTGLFLGLGAVALLVGGVGIANVMVISVLERRSEVGLRRALGATKRHISAQFLTESLLLALLGGIAGVLLGAVVTLVYATSSGLPVVIPLVGVFGGLLAALVIGAVAGFYPALRAARLAPTEALRTA